MKHQLCSRPSVGDHQRAKEKKPPVTAGFTKYRRGSTWGRPRLLGARIRGYALHRCYSMKLFKLGMRRLFFWQLLKA